MTNMQSKRKIKSIRAKTSMSREHSYCTSSFNVFCPLHDMTLKPWMEKENGNEDKIINMSFFLKYFDWFTVQSKKLQLAQQCDID